MVTLLHEQRQTELADDCLADQSLWLDAAALDQALGWSLQPQGMCKDDICVPISPRQRAQWVRDNRVDIAGLWRDMGQPVVNDESGRTWVFGSGAELRSRQLSSLQAPDFELPDQHGRMHRLSDYRGRKVLLVTWASW